MLLIDKKKLLTPEQYNHLQAHLQSAPKPEGTDRLVITLIDLAVQLVLKFVKGSPRWEVVDTAPVDQLGQMSPVSAQLTRAEAIARLRGAIKEIRAFRPAERGEDGLRITTLSIAMHWRDLEAKGRHVIDCVNRKAYDIGL